MSEKDTQTLTRAELLIEKLYDEEWFEEAREAWYDHLRENGENPEDFEMCADINDRKAVIDFVIDFYWNN